MWFIKKHLKLIGKSLLYLGFLFVIFTLWTSQNSTLMKGVLTLIMVFVLMSNILYDYLKKLNEDLQIALVVECDLDKVSSIMERIKRFDVFKGMKPTLILTQTLVYLDAHNPQGCINHIKEHESFFTGHPDYLLIHYHSLFKSYVYLGDVDEATENYTQLQRFKQTSKKKNDISQLYSWHEIDADYYHITKSYKKSLEAYKAVDLKRYNNRECIHYYYGRACLELDMKHRSNIRKYCKQIEDINKDSPYIGALNAYDETI
ncbi:hypothetical protein AOC36_01475 [Erysipelothrix larvae]|uniref:Uncharacterized protein n=1 Tax=Erysipelothrix larvae TaxID=1514105 RepID=A0A120JTF1_9FIRM|nr:hypothetical protein [Erysipelothrix larvae]AMC92703.1 hypothetical protein AOC36_01475 [Erysipelothrix larvae]